MSREEGFKTDRRRPQLWDAGGLEAAAASLGPPRGQDPPRKGCRQGEDVFIVRDPARGGSSGGRQSFSLKLANTKINKTYTITLG